MASPYRVLCADLIPPAGSSGIREELRVHDLKYDFVLDAPGAFSGWVDLDDPKCTRANLNPGATAIYIERGGLLVWGGILWTAKADTITRKLELGGEGFLSYFDHRLIKNRTAMTSVTASSSNTYRPNADVSSSGLNGNPDAVNLWNNLAEAALDVNTNLLSVGGGTPMAYQARYSVAGGAFSGLIPAAVRVVAIAASQGSLRTGNTQLIVAGTPYSGAPTRLRATPTIVSNTWSYNPNTGQPWTAAGVESLGSSNSAGFFTDPSVFGGDIALYQLWIEISWGTSGTAVFLQADQLAIARDLINNAQAQPGGSIGVTVGNEFTTDNGGTLMSRDRTYYTYERKNTGDALSELAAVLNGFDFSIEVAWDTTGTIPQKQLVLYYPRRGRRIDGLVFNHNIAGVSKFEVAVDATKQANSIDAIGQGDGDNMLIASASDTSMVTTYPLLEDTVSYKDVNIPETLTEYAQVNLGRRKLPIELPTIEKNADVWPDFGSFQIGDEGLVVASDSWVNYSSYQRIQTVAMTVTDEGFETMSIGFVNADASIN